MFDRPTFDRATGVCKIAPACSTAEALGYRWQQRQQPEPEPVQ